MTPLQVNGDVRSRNASGEGLNFNVSNQNILFRGFFFHLHGRLQQEFNNTIQQVLLNLLTIFYCMVVAHCDVLCIARYEPFLRATHLVWKIDQRYF